MIIVNEIKSFLILVNVGPYATSLVADVVVPASMATVVVVTH